MRQILFPIVIGLGGIIILLLLGFWQLERLEWKLNIIRDIDAQVAADPVPLPVVPSRDTDNYLTVIMQGAATGEEIRFLDSGTAAGTGHHIISVFVTIDGRRIMLDQGLLEINDAEARALPPLTAEITVQGNLIWPDDVSGQAPVEDEWYARDVFAMADVLDTEPVLVELFAASQYDVRLSPLGVNTRNIKNDHLEYAITWFLLAAVWFSMTGFYVARSMRSKGG
ncbi:MAG: surfeit locus 1 family protein [Octadecabacter sp.]|jgi:surfeit locus 1 family protein